MGAELFAKAGDVGPHGSDVLIQNTFIDYQTGSIELFFPAAYIVLGCFHGFLLRERRQD